MLEDCGELFNVQSAAAFMIYFQKKFFASELSQE